MLTIGQVSSRTGLRVSAIRYYESLGLLAAPTRIGGKRVFDDSIIERLAVIQLAKAAGFSLHEIGVLSRVGQGKPAAAWRTLAKAKRREIETEMQRLMLTKYVLTKMSACSCATLRECGRTFLEAVTKRS
jgi:MerR family transcriptional regulator, redox-sensitive transcriptional activator SoxR